MNSNSRVCLLARRRRGRGPHRRTTQTAAAALPAVPSVALGVAAAAPATPIRHRR